VRLGARILSVDGVRVRTTADLEKALESTFKKKKKTMVRIIFSRTNLEVFDVKAGSQAQQCGVEVGWTVHTIEHKEVTTLLQFEEVVQRLHLAGRGGARGALAKYEERRASGWTIRDAGAQAAEKAPQSNKTDQPLLQIKIQFYLLPPEVPRTAHGILGGLAGGYISSWGRLFEMSRGGRNLSIPHPPTPANLAVVTLWMCARASQLVRYSWTTLFSYTLPSSWVSSSSVWRSWFWVASSM
jgi:hypothetical protein